MKHWKLVLSTLGFLGVALLAGTALAQAEGGAAADPAGAAGAGAPAADTVQTIYKKTTIIDFSDVTITGELTKPEGSYLMNKKKANFNLLIRVRDDFLPEMIKSVDNL
ncbi:MAG TPA: hypothetical protein PK668_13580 [Myxococcota bacterium]|nr:hypothetical protein [Myxococcota bacterium]HRY94107.1 hypothetical protein [Myxococcota bacterium]